MAAPGSSHPAGAKGSPHKTQTSDTAQAEKKESAQKSNPPDKPTPSASAISGCLEWISTDPQKGSKSEGTTVHRVIREWFDVTFRRQYGRPVSVRLPDASFAHFRTNSGLEIGNKYHGQGDVDLAYRFESTKEPAKRVTGAGTHTAKGEQSLGHHSPEVGAVMMLGEIKPANWNFDAGVEQLRNYIEKANANDKVKARYDVKEFSPMLPERFSLPPFIYVQGEKYELRWCLLGMLLYKKLKKNKEEEKEKTKQKQEQKQAKSEEAYKDQVAEQRKSATAGRAISNPLGVKVLTVKPRALEPWTPERLRRDIETGALQNGVYRDRYSAAWPSGHVTNVVVWVRSGEVQYFQEFPTSKEYYDWFAKKRGISERQADLVRRTLIDYNEDLWRLIAPDPVTKAPSSRSPDYARQYLRTVYGEILKGVFLGSAALVGTGAGITSAASAIRQRTATGGETIPGPPRETGVPEPTVSTSVPKGVDPDQTAEAIFRSIERILRQTEKVP